MNDTEFDRESLQQELDTIKEAMRIHDRYPTFALKFLLVGVFVGGFVLTFDLDHRGVFGEWLGLGIQAAWVFGAIAAYHLFVPTDVKEAPDTGLPWTHYLVTLLVGMAALVAAFYPTFESAGVPTYTFLYVFLGVVAGVGYVNAGVSLRGGTIRTADRYSVVAGGLVLLLVTAATQWIPSLSEWGLTVIGAAFVVHGIASYLLLTRL